MRRHRYRRGNNIPLGPLAVPVDVTLDILASIITARNRYIAQMCHWNQSATQVLTSLFDKETLAACKTGWDHCTDYNRIGKPIYDLPSNVTISLPCEHLELLSPRAEYMRPPFLALPLLASYCQQVRDIMFNFAKVEHVFKWFNEDNASAAALRSYCPWVMSLMQTTDHKYFTSERFKEPDKLGKMLPLIREAAGTMAAALLIQGDPPGQLEMEGMTLTFTVTKIDEIMVPSMSLTF